MGEWRGVEGSETHADGIANRPGSLKSITMERLQEKWGGGEVLRRAVRGMLPKNRLRDDRMARLKCFEGEAHPYKRNILRMRESSMVRMPQVRETMAAERTEGMSAPPPQ